MRNISVELEGYGDIWTPQNNLMSLEVTLGQNELSSSVNIMLADPGNKIGAALINHSIQKGGIQALEGTGGGNTGTTNNTPPVPQVTTTPGNAETGVASRGEGFTPNVLAFMDVLAEKEVGGYTGVGRYYIRLGGGTFTEREATNGFPPSSGDRPSGRYQFKRSTFQEIQSRFPGKFTNFLPETQDRAVIAYMSYHPRLKVSLAALQAGDFERAVRFANGVWTSLPEGRESNFPMAEAKALWEQRVRFYAGSTTQPQQTTKTEPQVALQDLRPDIPQAPQAPVKGSKLTVSIDDVTFEFIHQGTETNDKQITTVMGQGLRWVLSRRKRNKTLQNITLKELAESVANAHGIKAVYQANYNPTFEHVSQDGISDYQLLLREANFAGLYVSEEVDKKTITVKSREFIRDSGYVISLDPSNNPNCLSYKVEDKALDMNNTENTSLLQDEPKASVEPTTGQLKPELPDVDKTKDKSASGDQKKPIHAVIAPGQDARLAEERARMKRIKGLPSSFVVPLSAATLLLKPLDAVRTIGLPETLNRIWLVDEVTHNVTDETTTLTVYSPVEVVDSSPTPNVPTPSNTNIPANTKWVYPHTGTITSVVKMRGGRMHRGIDSSSVAGKVPGGNIVSVGDGVVKKAITGCVLGDSNCGGQFGNHVIVRHPDGSESLYAHLHRVSVATGQQVKIGQVLGVEGSTGSSTGTHLHFEFSTPTQTRVNPASVFPRMGREGNRITAGEPV